MVADRNSLREVDMQKINMGRVILGGLIAGVVINLGEFALNMGVLGSLWDEAMKALNRPPIGNESAVFFMLLCFGLGIVGVWTYAAIRSRFGAGPLTALCAGLLIWALAILYPSAGMIPMGLFPAKLILYAIVWDLVEIPVAVIAGAWLYKE
jgi:hypothetical protein